MKGVVRIGFLRCLKFLDGLVIDFIIEERELRVLGLGEEGIFFFLEV